MGTILKQLISGMIIGVFMMIQAPLSALAATDAEAAAAARIGVEYLVAQQQPDGSITSSGGQTDWSVVAIEASGIDAATLTSGSGNSVVDALEADGPGSVATDIERKVIAIAATGGDITNFGGENYSTILAGYQSSNQIGDPDLLNDDIFGVIAIDASGRPELRGMAQDGLDYMLANQELDGGFSYTTVSCPWCGSDSNDTAAAIIAMYAAEHMNLQNSNLAAGKSSAVVYLLSTQQADGGFAYDSFSFSDDNSTAWGLMALNVIGEPVRAQALLARNYLLLHQNADGSFSGYFGKDTVTTAHAVTALLGSTWLLRPAPLALAASNTNPASQLPAGGSQNKTAATTAVASSNNTPAVLASSQEITNGVASSTSQTAPFRNSAGQNAAQPTINPASQPKKTSYSIYAAALLVFAALAWFVVESRKGTEGSK